MPKLPAICQKCGRASLSEVTIRDDTYHLPATECGTCECGGALRIPGGTYSHLGGPLNYCNAPAEDLMRFRDGMEQLGQDWFCNIE